MTDLAFALLPEDEHIVSEVIEGDAVIINISTSVYHSTEGVGGWVWDQCAAGLPLGQIAAELSSAFQLPLALVQADLSSFAETLMAEGLVRKAGAAAAPQPKSATPLPNEYSAPALISYRDMKDLLALDPPMPRFTFSD